MRSFYSKLKKLLILTYIVLLSPFCLINLKSLQQNNTRKINCLKNRIKKDCVINDMIEANTSPEMENVLKVEPDCWKWELFGIYGKI